MRKVIRVCKIKSKRIFGCEEKKNINPLRQEHNQETKTTIFYTI